MSVQEWLKVELGLQGHMPQVPATLHTIANYLEGRYSEAQAVSSIVEINHESILWKGTNVPLLFLWYHVAFASRFVGLEPTLCDRTTLGLLEK
jgi:hypothetical protein